MSAASLDDQHNPAPVSPAPVLPQPEELYPAPIKTVEAGSPAERAGVRPGDFLLRVNGASVTDVLAYRHALSQGKATLEMARPAAAPKVMTGVPGTAQDHHRLFMPQEPGLGETFSFDVEWEDPGLDFEEVLFDGIKKCANKCDFCYVHQMPRGFRKSLYIMDDDYRLSFLYGSFVTLTNLTEGDINRILDENLSPLYVSVHTANQELRQDLMRWWKLKVKDPQAVQIRGMIERLESIDLYTQIVLVPGRNDREHLDDTVEYLSSRPNVLSAAVVPIGLTSHRTNLPDVRTFSREDARTASTPEHLAQEVSERARHPVHLPRLTNCTCWPENRCPARKNTKASRCWKTAWA